jgi:hypothetical protein
MIFQKFVENLEQNKAFEFEIFIRKNIKTIKSELI